MNPNWSDFEKYVFQKLDDLSVQVAALRGRAAVWGALAGIVGSGLFLALFEIFLRVPTK